MDNVTKIKSNVSNQGPGRRLGSGKYQEPTTVIRIPESQKSAVTDFLELYARKQQQGLFKLNLDSVHVFEYPASNSPPVNLPLFNSSVPAGIPSPADDHIEKRLDPSEFLIDQKDATFFVTIQGESMLDAGLLPGDKAVVDRSKMPVIGDIVLAMIDSEFTIKILSRNKQGFPKLLPANGSSKFQPIEINEHMQFEVWGVVTGSFRRFR